MSQVRLYITKLTGIDAGLPAIKHCQPYCIAIRISPFDSVPRVCRDIQVFARVQCGRLRVALDQ